MVTLSKGLAAGGPPAGAAVISRESRIAARILQAEEAELMTMLEALDHRLELADAEGDERVA